MESIEVSLYMTGESYPFKTLQLNFSDLGVLLDFIKEEGLNRDFDNRDEREKLVLKESDFKLVQKADQSNVFETVLTFRKVT
ncbi:hypothetical protein [Paenibacillus sp. FSL P4-0288]|uniref:hypothetical protein n=1 Tax=Paenibacillus sp. FSL P4-0288 TaxID=2921633 RepID=UPI0030FAE2A3